MINIDFHSHILHGVDDGAKEIEESIAMLEILEKSGVEQVVLSPHFYCGNTDMVKLIESRKVAFEELRAKYCGKMQLHLASEVGVNFKYRKFEDLKNLKISGTDYILLELPFVKDWAPLGEWLVELMEETNLIPIIAHVEYYENILKKPQLVSDLVDMGCKIQVNATSFCDVGLLPFVSKLLEYGYIHCIGSDSHNLTKRPPKIAECCDVLNGFDVEYIEKINLTSEKIITNKKFGSRYKKVIKRFFKKYI